MLEEMMKHWRAVADCPRSVGETWKTMRPYILGCPHGSRSSLFINQEDGQQLKTIYTKIVETECYGPVFRD